MEERENKDGNKVGGRFEFGVIFEQECLRSEKYVQTERYGAPFWRGGLRTLYG
jgi:hypothetical protein